jgi:dihydroorotase
MPAFSITSARLIDPATGLDIPGTLVVEDGVIAAFGPDVTARGETLDAGGHMLMPGLVDLRVVVGEPGAEHRETFRSAGRAAAAGGVTTMVVQPSTDPVIDDAAMVDYVIRRGAARARVRVLPAGALTVGLRGEGMTEIGLMAEAGAVMFSNGPDTVRDNRVLRRIFQYAAGFDVLVSLRPRDGWLSQSGVMAAGEIAGRLGLSGMPDVAERIGLERDLALAQSTGVRLLVDQVSAAATLEPLRRARTSGLRIAASVAVANLVLNDIDVGEYRTFAKLDPPLRSEDDRQALLDALSDGTLDIVVSAHEPRPAEEKRLPFDEAAFGAVGLETLLPALLGLAHEGRVALDTLLRAVTSAPADLLGLPQGRLKVGAPADLILVDAGRPLRLEAAALRSKSRNTPFDGRLMQGAVLHTWVGGESVYRLEDNGGGR